MEENTNNEMEGGKKGASKFLIFGAIGVLILVVAVGFVLARSAKNTAGDAMNTEMDAESSANEEMMESADDESMEQDAMAEAREITVEAKEFSYSPSAITVKRGQKVKIVLKNVGKMTHDLVIEELDSLATSIIKPGETDTLEFTVPDVSGNLTYYCSVGNHRAQGMEGKITIE